MSRLRFLLSLLARGVIGCLAGLGLGLLAITYVGQVTSAAADEPPPPATGIPVDSTPGGNAVLSWPLVNNFIISTVISLATLYGFYKRVQIGGEGERRSLDARLKGRAA
jgi:ABC-type antimicrobial peptide transport system permease subunit